MTSQAARPLLPHQQPQSVILKAVPDSPELTRTYEQMLVASLALFAEDVLKVQLAPHLLEWEELVQNNRRVAVNAARDHSKSTWFSYCYPIWRIWSEPGCEVYIFSKTLDQAVEFLDIIIYGKDNLRGMLDIPELQHLVPSLEGKKSGRSRLKRTDVRFRNGSRIRAIGYGKSIRGAHPKYVVCDDVLNDEDMYSDTVRKKNITYFQSAIVNMVKPDGQICVVGCVTEDAWVPTSDGLRQIGDLRPGPRAPQTMHELSVRVEGRRGLKEATQFWDNGVCETRKVKLENGMLLEGSLRHPVLVMPKAGVPKWRRFRKLKVGDWVAIKTGTESWGSSPQSLDEDTAYLMGLWCAEGSSEPPHRLTIASAVDAEIHAFLKARPERWLPHRGGTHWRCSNTKMMAQWESWGVEWVTSHHKRIPKAIMSGSRECAVAWVQGYLDGDGNYYEDKNGNAQVAVGSVSGGLINDLQVLLLNLGVQASQFVKLYVPTKIAPNGSPLHMLRALGDHARSLAKFGFRLSRKRHDRPLLDTGFRVPNQQTLLRAAMSSKPRFARGHGEKTPFNVSELLNGSLRLTSLRIAADWYEKHGADRAACSAMRDNASGQLRWAQVKSIEAGRAYTVDFVVPDGHSFVSNGVVSHNTPYHISDLYGWLRKNPKYVFRKYPGIIKTKSGKERPLFSWRWTLKALKDKLVEIGSIAFAREILVEPITDDVAIFPSYLFPPLFDATLSLRPKRSVIKKMGLSVYVGVDIARSASVGADYFVIFVIGVDNHGVHYLLDIQRHKGLKFNQQIDLIKAAGFRYRADMILIEAVSMQQVWTDEVIRTTDLPVKPFVTSAQNKYPLDKGVPGLRILLENEKLVIPRGSPYSVLQTDIWISECAQFGFIDGKLQGIGEHDDTVMAWWMAEEAAKLGGFSFSMGDDEDGEESDEMTGGEGGWEDDYLGKDEEFEEGADEEGGEGDGDEDSDDGFGGDKSLSGLTL